MVLAATLLFIVGYGVWKTRGSRNIEGFLLGGKNMKWGTIGLSIMATQASAITFLSTPGQAFLDGMGFVQFYFGLPIAMVILCMVVIPIYHRLKVYTAYEYLESRFDLKSRLLTAFLFLISRGLAAGITIYAPAIILSTLLQVPLNATILIIGVLVIIYTVSGGTRAVSQTQKQQMVVIMVGMVVAFVMLINLMPEKVTFGKALSVAGHMGKMEVVDFSFDLSNRYTFWSGILGGVFLFASYFGTDQSQVQRYLGGKSVTESRMGLLFNALFKVPMQFFILLVGVMVFVFYQFVKPPVFFNQQEVSAIENSSYAPQFHNLEDRHQAIFDQKQPKLDQLIVALENQDQQKVRQLRTELRTLEDDSKQVHDEVVQLMKANNPQAETKDADYIFINWVVDYLPHGIIGLLMAVILSAAMSSTSSELNALASTTTVDFYKRSFKKEGSERHYLVASKVFTVMWGILAILFALFSNLLDNLIQAVNILGSIFYGPILGIFLVAFAVKYVKSQAVFIAVFIAEALVVLIYWMTETGVVDIAYLWLNPIGCFLVLFIALLLQFIINNSQRSQTSV